MKITLEFDGEDAREQATAAMNVHHYRGALLEFHQFLRRHYKHGSSDDPKTEIAEEFNTELMDCLKRRGIEDLYS